MTHGTEAASLGGPAQPAAPRGRKRLALILLTILAVIAALLAGGGYAFASQYDGRALPGTTVLGNDVSGQTPEEIAAFVQKRAEAVKVSVSADDEEHEATLEEVGATVDAEATAQAALDRDDSFTGKVQSLWAGEHAVAPVVTVDEAKAADYATGLVPAEETKPVDAKVTFDENEAAWKVTPGQDGKGVDPSAFVAAVTEKAASLADFAVEQPITTVHPSITTEDAEKVVGEIAALLEQPMSIAGPDGTSYDVSAEQRNAWISVAPDEKGSALNMSIDEDAIREWVSSRAANSSIEPKDGIEQVDEDGKVLKVIAEKTDGREITNTDAVAAELVQAMKGSSPLEAAFESKTIEAKVTKAEAPKDEKKDDEKSDDDKKSDEKKDDEKAKPTGEKWIDVDLTAKTVTAYVGDTPVWGPRSMVDGKEEYETVTGSFRIYLRYEVQDMTNANRYPEGHEKYYYTPDVPWVQYFHGGYAFHGAPWRSSFGYSGSHGCINLPVADAKWLWDWASIGTRVEVHY